MSSGIAAMASGVGVNVKQESRVGSDSPSVMGVVRSGGATACRDITPVGMPSGVASRA